MRSTTRFQFKGPQDWAIEANCKGKLDLFFGPAGERPETRAKREMVAMRICEECGALPSCRNSARDHREYGYWGMESEEDRAAAGYRVEMPVGRVARYPKGNGEPITPKESEVA